jgi:hypothetical protein
MTTVRRIDDSLTKGIRWIARALGMLATGLFLLFVVSSGASIFPTLSWVSPRGMPLLVVLVVTVLGVLIAWRWEITGGAMAVLGACALSALVFWGAGRSRLSTSLMISLPFFTAGVLFLTCSWRTRTAAT